MEIYQILVHLHSVLRWALLLFVIVAIFYAARASSRGSGVMSLQPALWSLVMAHLQLVIGLVLYFISPKVIFEGASMQNPVYRFFLVEHSLVMVIAIALITIGYIKARRSTELKKKKNSLLIYFVIALLLMLSRIPWPFLNYGGNWI